jgi:prefoldin subunit 5
MGTHDDLLKIKHMYQNTLQKLKEYSGCNDKEVNVPINSVGFIKGKLVNTDQIIVCMSPELYIKTDLSASETIINNKLQGNS